MLNDGLNVVISGDSSENQYVQVPIKKKDFGDFITKLLGQPENISGVTAGTFEASHEWLVHLHHLIDQRIKQQSSSALVDFSAKLKYDKGPDRKITTIDGLLHFNEAKIVSTKSISITWTYLVSFPNKPAPEKQEISVQLITEKTASLSSELPLVGRTITTSMGIAKFSVSHTERTWGDDIASLLEREIDTIFEAETWFSRIAGYSVFVVALSMLAIGIFLPDYIEQLIREKEVADIFLSVMSAGVTPESLAINEKLNLVIKLLDPTNKLFTGQSWYKGVSFVVGIGLSVATLIIFSRENPSFILMTKKDREVASRLKISNNRHFIKQIASYALAVSAGVAGNYAYYYLNL